MNKEARVAATIPAQDIKRAKAWYADKLGLTPSSAMPDGGAVYELGRGTGFLLFPSSGKSSGNHTQMAIETEDFDRDAESLRTRGVKFEEYDTPDFKTVNGIAEMGPIKAAFFRDSEGNLLSIGTPVPAMAKSGS